MIPGVAESHSVQCAAPGKPEHCQQAEGDCRVSSPLPALPSTGPILAPGSAHAPVQEGLEAREAALSQRNPSGKPIFGPRAPTGDAPSSLGFLQAAPLN